MVVYMVLSEVKRVPSNGSSNDVGVVREPGKVMKLSWCWEILPDRNILRASRRHNDTSRKKDTAGRR
jgi:hypothetical protein